jgi:hypothetical protein
MPLLLLFYWFIQPLIRQSFHAPIDSLFFFRLFHLFIHYPIQQSISRVIPLSVRRRKHSPIHSLFSHCPSNACNRPSIHFPIKHASVKEPILSKHSMFNALINQPIHEASYSFSSSTIYVFVRPFTLFPPNTINIGTSVILLTVSAVYFVTHWVICA